MTYYNPPKKKTWGGGHFMTDYTKNTKENITLNPFSGDI